MLIRHETLLATSAAHAWAAVLQPRLLDHVAWPLQTFEPIDPSTLPTIWSNGSYRVRLHLFGLLPLGQQTIGIEVLEQGPTRYRLRDNGRGQLVRRWDHVITIAPVSDTQCRYVDEVDVRAGLLTPAIAAFAWVFYRHRQRRWRALVAAGFAPLKSGAIA